MLFISRSSFFLSDYSFSHNIHFMPCGHKAFLVFLKVFFRLLLSLSLALCIVSWFLFHLGRFLSTLWLEVHLVECRKLLPMMLVRAGFLPRLKKLPPSSCLGAGAWRRCLGAGVWGRSLSAALQKLAEPSDSHSPIGRYLLQYHVVSFTLKMSAFYDIYFFHHFFKKMDDERESKENPCFCLGAPKHRVFLQGDTVQSNNDMSSIFNFEYFSSLTKK